MHPLPPAHCSFRPYHNGAHAIVPPKTISRSQPRRPELPIEVDRPPTPPLIYWPPIALTGIVCLMLMSGGLLLAVGVGKRPVAQTEAQLDDASSVVAAESGVADSSLFADAPAANPLNDDGNVALPPAPILAAASAPFVDATPLNPQPLDPFADAADDAQAPAPPKTLATAACKRYGTSVDFVDNPIDAASQAHREKKLLFVLHVAGNFEEDKFT